MNKSKDKININPDIFSEIPRVSSKRCLVAYLDILGSGDRIENDTDDTQLNIIYSINCLVRKIFNHYITELHIDNLKIKIFSDNIAIAKEIEDDECIDDKVILSYFVFIGLAQVTAFALYGWSIRGGITIGNLFIDDLLIWGEALLRAYYLENKKARCPRVIVDDCVIDELNQELKQNLLDYEALKKDSDDVTYINYFKFMFMSDSISDFDDEFSNLLIYLQSQFECNLINYNPLKLDDDVRNKLKWIDEKFGEAKGDKLPRCNCINNGDLI